MSKILWDGRIHESGVSRGVIFPKGGQGIPWNGLKTVKRGSSERVETSSYIDGHKHISKVSFGNFSGVIEAFTYPEEVEETYFHLTYRTEVTNGYKIHLVYNATLRPQQIAYNSVTNSIDPSLFSWDLNTQPVKIPEYGFSSHLIIDSRYCYPWLLESFEEYLYGGPSNVPEMPSITEVIDIFEDASILRITDHGDGTWTARAMEGYEHIIQMLDPTTFEIDWESAIYISSNLYKISSL